MFYSDLDSRLRSWMGKKRDTIFTIDGPSQIGKTFFINRFLTTCGQRYLYIDVKIHKSLIDRLLNDSYKNADSFYTAICFEFSISPIVSLITFVFDGIEYCPKIRQFFKTLVQHPRLNILAITCGGLGPMHYKDLLIPSEEIIYHMHPLTFYEFMMETGQRTLAEHLKQSIMDKKPVSEYLSSKLYNLYKIYNLVGGYPLSVSSYFKNNDINKCIEINRNILREMFNHAVSLADKKDKDLLEMIYENIQDIISNNKYNTVSEISSYKMKQLLSFLEEEHVINVSTAIDIRDQSKQSSGKKVFYSHQCFYYAMDSFDKTNYFDGIGVKHSVVLIDFYFNQNAIDKPLNYALDRSARYSESDALVVGNTSLYLVEIKDKRLSIDYNLSMSAKSNRLVKPGFLLLNNNVFMYGEVCVLPSYCACFINYLM